MASNENPKKTALQPTSPDPPPTTRNAPVAGSGTEEAGPSSDTALDLSASQARRSYGTLDAQDLTTRSHPIPAAPAAPLSPQVPQVAKPKKPPLIRRTSTQRKPLPHRGELFSVDDNVAEVEEDRAGPILVTSTHAPLARQPSTLRRRQPGQIAHLPRVDSQDEDVDLGKAQQSQTPPEPVDEPPADEEPEDEDQSPEDEDDELSEAESFTLRDRQLAINETHPFGIRIWKPALYKKNRSVEKNADQDIHSSPSAIVSKWLWFFNCLWTLFFGWWLSLAAAFAALVCFVFAFEPSAAAYGRVFWALSGYLFWPFGQFVKLEQDETYAEEDEGEGRSISEYERWQSGDLEYGRLMFGPVPVFSHTGSILGRHRNSIDSTSEHDSLLGRTPRGEHSETSLTNNKAKRRLFGRGQWTLGRVIFFVFFYFLIAPLMLLVSATCWFMVFWIPMGRVLQILFYHLRRHPLALTFHPDVTHARDLTKPSSILLCTYRAVGTRYWKYTVDGTNIFLINFLVIVVFVIFDYFVLKEALGLHIWLTSPALLFLFALISVIPLAYFIGQAVASISAQSSMGMASAVNAFFSTIVEVYLYCIALNEGKGQLVEGSIIGSIFAGILLLPGLSMCFGAIRRKTQRFNVKSAGATSTMLLFATIAAFSPTLFYKIYGSHELICKTCNTPELELPRDCRQCYFRQAPAVNDDFFINAVRPYCWFAAVLLFSSYIIGLLFTLRTHAAVIWSTEIDEKKPEATGAPPTVAENTPAETRRQSGVNGTIQTYTPMYVPRSNVRETQLYKRIVGQSLRSSGFPGAGPDGNLEADEPASPHLDSQTNETESLSPNLPHVVPPQSHDGEDVTSPALPPILPGLSEEDNNNFVRQVTEIAATAATIAARDASTHPRMAAYQSAHSTPPPSQEHQKGGRPPATRHATTADRAGRSATVEPAGQQAGGHGHDAPNWSRAKSSIILVTATVAYAVIAEVLVNTVDVVLSSIDIDEKFLGITLFALVPNTTEFLNAISFAMNGNVALSMEIGSAYALQVCLLQIPALVLFSAVHSRFINPYDLKDYSFNLIFPQWDMVTVILCVFLLSYIYTEGKSNYFKGSILTLTYLVVLVGFYLSGFTTVDALGVDPNDTLAIMASYAFSQKNPGRTGALRREL